MKKQKFGLILILFFFFISSVLIGFSGRAWAAASATVSWTPPTTDEGGGALTGLAGYKVFYNTTSTWLNYVGACLVGSGTSVDIPGGAVDHYHFNDSLTPGTRYYFTVLAYDDADPANVSGCAITDIGSYTEVDKQVSYSGDIDGSVLCEVDNLDYTFLHTYYNGSNSTADISKDGVVDNLDYAYIHANYGDAPVTCDK